MRFIFLAVILGVALLPTVFFLKQHDPRSGYLGLILFGQNFQAKSLPEIKEQPLPEMSPDGYDGQFYAQIALDPALRRADLAPALDSPPYRAQRIFLPALAHVLGAGSPGRILQIYAVLNLFFFYALVFGMYLLLRPANPWQILCVTAVAWTSGVYASLSRSLTDLPSTTLLFYAAVLPAVAGGFMAAAAILTREMTVFSLGALVRRWPSTWAETGRLAFYLGLILLPAVLWNFYVTSRLGHNSPNFVGLPFVSYVEALSRAIRIMTDDHRLFRFFEIASLVSLMIQAAHFLIRPRFSSVFWRMGAPLALLFLFFQPPMLAEQYAFTRILLPMTLAFNLQLFSLPWKKNIGWFLAGNAGLCWGLTNLVFHCLT